MKRWNIGVCALAFCTVVSLPCLAQANPWNGSWKINPSSVKFDGASFGVTTQADGYTIVRDGKPAPETVCDSKPHKSPTGDMVSCTKTANGYSLDIWHNGTRVQKATVSVSGNTMTRRMEIYTPGEPADTMTVHFQRLSGGPGAAGEWKEQRFVESQDHGVLSIDVKGDTVAFKETDSVKPVMCKLDGTQVKFPDGGTMAVTKDGARTLKVTYRGDDGKVRRENTFELSADGKTLTETDRTPAPSASTMSMTFHKM